MADGEHMTEEEILKLCINRNIKIEPCMFRDNIIRKNAYNIMGYTLNAFNDRFWEIRKEAYIVLGWTTQALIDPVVDIRKEAYYIFGFDENSLNDDNWKIRKEALEYFDIRSKYTKKEAETIVRLWQLERL